MLGKNKSKVKELEAEPGIPDAERARDGHFVSYQSLTKNHGSGLGYLCWVGPSLGFWWSCCRVWVCLNDLPKQTGFVFEVVSLDMKQPPNTLQKGIDSVTYRP